MYWFTFSIFKKLYKLYIKPFLKENYLIMKHMNLSLKINQKLVILFNLNIFFPLLENGTQSFQNITGTSNETYYLFMLQLMDHKPDPQVVIFSLNVSILRSGDRKSYVFDI